MPIHSRVDKVIIERQRKLDERAKHIEATKKLELQQKGVKTDEELIAERDAKHADLKERYQITD
jgi:DNA-binding Xre family transcriptional regulator